MEKDAAGFRRSVEGIVSGAGKKIREETRESLEDASNDYRNLVYDLSGKVRETHRIVKSWYIGIGCVLALALVLLFAVVRYTVSDLADKRAQLENYDNAIAVAKAYANSDAYVCGDRLCINPGKAVESGYRQAKQRRR